jgi:hypothetical protein
MLFASTILSSRKFMAATTAQTWAVVSEMPQWNNPDMSFCGRLRALREERKLYQGGIEKRSSSGSGSQNTW